MLTFFSNESSIQYTQECEYCGSKAKEFLQYKNIFELIQMGHDIISSSSLFSSVFWFLTKKFFVIPR